jgi:hypothetical protein
MRRSTAVFVSLLVGFGFNTNANSVKLQARGIFHPGGPTLLSSTGNVWAAEADPAAGADNAASTPETDLVAFSSGALVVQKPSEYSDGWSAFLMLDERPGTGWATTQGVVSNQTAVIELPDRCVFTMLGFDTAHVENAGRAAKDITVEMSDTSMTSGFRKIADVTLKDMADGQKFPVQASVPGRWVRLTFHNNFGDPKYLECMEFRAYGKRLAETAMPDISGSYDTNFGVMHLRQQGTSVVGCYDHKDGLLEGGIEGRVMKLTWRENDGGIGPAVMVFTGDGKQLVGLWWHQGSEGGAGNPWNGPKVGSVVGTCPHWSGDAGKQMTSDLEQTGKARIYGINFDTDSDHIRDESRTTLGEIVAMLKANPDWKLKVEGHTDSTSTAEHNQQLSERRANAVKAYLVTAGIDPSRLTSAGYGATQPVAPNDTELGRAQNRRVELVKM